MTVESKVLSAVICFHFSVDCRLFDAPVRNGSRPLLFELLYLITCTDLLLK